MSKKDDQIIVIFGASGDLTVRKLIPALYHLCKGGYLPKNFVVLGASRTDMTDEEFRKKVIDNSKFMQDELKVDDECISDFRSRLYYQDLGGDYKYLHQYC